MLRLYCLAQGMKRMSAEEVNGLIKGNDYYSKLIRTLPWVEPYGSRYAMFQLMMMCGIARKEIRSVIEDVPADHTLNRIRKNDTLPDGYIVAGHELLDNDTYIEVCQSFWWNVLEPLQIGPWAVEEPTPLVKMYWCQKQARANAYTLLKVGASVNPAWEFGISTLQSMAKISHMDCLLEWNQDNYPELTKGKYYTWFGQYDNYYTVQDKNLKQYAHPDYVKHVNEMYYGMPDIIDEMYLFLYHCDMFGFVNSYMMEGDWQL